MILYFTPTTFTYTHTYDPRQIVILDDKGYQGLIFSPAWNVLIINYDYHLELAWSFLSYCCFISKVSLRSCVTVNTELCALRLRSIKTINIPSLLHWIGLTKDINVFPTNTECITLPRFHLTSPHEDNKPGLVPLTNANIFRAFLKGLSLKSRNCFSLVDECWHCWSIVRSKVHKRARFMQCYTISVESRFTCSYFIIAMHFIQRQWTTMLTRFLLLVLIGIGAETVSIASVLVKHNYTETTSTTTISSLF